MVSLSRTSRALLLVLFVGSGCAALIYEIIWFQLLELIIGSTAVSMGVLLGTYMGGMCLGSLLLPRFLSARRHPLFIYAVLELGIGLSGLLVLWAIPAVGRFYLENVGPGFAGILLRGTICGVCLLPPTLMMGATLPVVARWLDTTPQSVSWMGFFYAGNIAGAVAGCLLAGFYLLRVHDMPTATYVAVAINGAVALLGWVMVRRAPPMPAVFPRVLMGAVPETGPGRMVYVAIALSGLCALGAEVIWTRLMSMMFGGSVYTFSLILAVFLSGLGIGGTAGSALARGKTNPRAALGWCQLLLAAAIAWGAFAIAGWLPFWAFDPAQSGGPWRVMGTDLVRCALAILPAAFLWGASFPLALAAASATRDRQDPARLVGNVYAANTLGAIIGALAFSMLVIPRIGTWHAQQLLIALTIVSALLALAPALASWRSRAAVLIVTTLVIALGLSLPPIPQALFTAGRFATKSGPLKALYLGEGMNSSVAVTEKPDGSRLFHVGGKIEASTSKLDMRLQRMLGHLSALLPVRPRSVLVVGFGAGITAGTFATYPDVERIVICEIEPLIPRVVSTFFKEANHDIMHDPRVQVVYDDARHFILTTREKFDVITSDPIHPWVKGAATLYTQEYFEMVKRHLHPGGVVSQWVPLYETSSGAVKSEIATFVEIFPDATLWSTSARGFGYDLVMVGQAGPAGPIDADQLAARLQQPDHAQAVQSLREGGFNTVFDLFATYAGRGPDLRPWLMDAEINHDMNLRLQYLAGLSLNQFESTRIQDQILAYRKFPEDLFSRADAVRIKLRESLGRSGAETSWVDAALRSDQAPEAVVRRGIALATARQWPEAIASFQEALRLDPNNAEAHAGLGNVFLTQGQFPQAIARYQEALRLKPDDDTLRARLELAEQMR